MTDKVDRFGAVASTLCAAHCAVCALLPAAFGVLGLGFLLGHEAEWIFTIVAAAFATGALVHGWRRHRSPGIALLLVVGIAGLLLARSVEGGSHQGHDDAVHLAGSAVGILAALVLVAGHILNLRASRCAEECA